MLKTVLPLNDDWVGQNMQIFVALAIPILLFSSNIKQWLRLAPTTLRAYGLYLIAILSSMALSIWWWQDSLIDAPIRGAMATGVFTGGTANMAAIHVALEAPAALFAELNFTDIVLCGSFFLVLLSVLPNLLSRFLPPFQSQAEATSIEESSSKEENRSLSKSILFVLVSLLGGGMILGISFGLTKQIMGNTEGPLIMIMITVLGLLFSLVPKVRNWPLSYETGDFLFLAFCIAAGAQIDLRILWENDWSSAGFLVTAFLGTISLFLILARLFKVDVDTVLICLTAGLFGPPFIGPVAQKLNNREIVVSGMTLGVVGLAIGNFAGLLIYAWLS